MINQKHKSFHQYHFGFTIVELLVVIAVIGILAAITVVSYTGISQKAITASIQADLSSAFRRLKLFQVDNNGYPIDQSAILTCPLSSTALCLNLSSSNTIGSYTVDNSSSPQTFTLRIQNGSIAYQITESLSAQLVAATTPVNSIAVSGNALPGSVLTAGSLSPAAATVNYQWQNSDTIGGTYVDISGATNSTYTITAGDTNKYIKVVATGYGSYSGSVESISPLIATPVNSIAVSGTALSGSVLTAGSLSPAAATVNYQWQNSDTIGGTYVNISGASNSTYILTAGDINKYVKVVATGYGAYSGSVESISPIVFDSSLWLVIGSQIWSRTNLNVGTMINSSVTQTNNATAEKYCPADTAANCTTHGGLYIWDEAMQYVTTLGAQGLCPANSHIPTDTEFATLFGASGGTMFRVGGSTGFNAQLAGSKWSGGFINFNGENDLWSSKQVTTNAWIRIIYSGNDTINGGNNGKTNAYSVRCIKS